MPISATSDNSSLQFAAAASAPPPLQAALAGDSSFGCVFEWAVANLAASTNHYLFNWPGVMDVRYQTADANLQVGIFNASGTRDTFSLPCDALTAIAGGAARVLVAVDFDHATDRVTVRFRSTAGSGTVKATSASTFPQPWSNAQNANFALPGAMTSAGGGNVCARGIHGPMIWLSRPITDGEFDAFWAEPFGEIVRAVGAAGIDEGDVRAIYHRVFPSGTATASDPMRIYRSADASPTRWDTRSPAAATALSVANWWPNSAGSTPSLEAFNPETLTPTDVGGLAAPVRGIAPALAAFLANQWDEFSVGLRSNSRGARGFPSPAPHASGLANSHWASGLYDAAQPVIAGVAGSIVSLMGANARPIVPVLLTFGSQAGTAGGGAFPSRVAAWSEATLAGSVVVLQQSSSKKRLGSGSVDGTNGPGVGHFMGQNASLALVCDLLAAGVFSQTALMRRGVYRMPGVAGLTVTRQKKIFTTSVWTDVGEAEIVDMDSSAVVAVWAGADSVATADADSDTLVFAGAGNEARNAEILAAVLPGMLVQNAAQVGLFEVVRVETSGADVRVVVAGGGLAEPIDGFKVSIGFPELVYFDWEINGLAVGNDAFAFRLVVTTGAGDAAGSGGSTHWPLGPRGGSVHNSGIGGARPLWCLSMGWGGVSFADQEEAAWTMNTRWIAATLDAMVLSDASQGVTGTDGHRDNFLAGIDAAGGLCDVVLLDDLSHAEGLTLFEPFDAFPDMIAGAEAAARARRVPLLPTRNAVGDLIRQDALGWRQDGSHPYVGGFSHALFSAFEIASASGAFLGSTGTARVERIRSAGRVR